VKLASRRSPTLNPAPRSSLAERSRTSRAQPKRAIVGAPSRDQPRLVKAGPPDAAGPDQPEPPSTADLLVP